MNGGVVALLLLAVAQLALPFVLTLLDIFEGCAFYGTLLLSLTGSLIAEYLVMFGQQPNRWNSFAAGIAFSASCFLICICGAVFLDALLDRRKRRNDKTKIHQ